MLSCNSIWYLTTSLFVVQSNRCISERAALENDTGSKGQMISLLHQTFVQIRYFFCVLQLHSALSMTEHKTGGVVMFVVRCNVDERVLKYSKVDTCCYCCDV